MAHILVVDDETIIRLTIRAILEPEGHHVVEAASAEEALEVVGQHIPDVILLDLMMPGMDGWHFLEELRARDLRSKTRVVIVSALTDEETLRRGVDEGARGHIAKPFDTDVLIDAVNGALEEEPEQLAAKRERVGDLALLIQRFDEMDRLSPSS